MTTVERIIGNARRLAKDAFHTAAALDIMAPIAGRRWSAVCCGCLDAREHDIPREFVYRLAMYSWMSFPGWCELCPYSGCDTLVSALAVVSDPMVGGPTSAVNPA